MIDDKFDNIDEQSVFLFSPGLPKWLESVKVSIGFPVVGTDG